MEKREGFPEGTRLIFLKLGGSLITDKSTPRTPRLEVIQRICAEIKSALEAEPGLRILLGHGSGSFGHYSAKVHQTLEGVDSASEWLGFAEVWQDAAALNWLVMDCLKAAGLPGICFAPSAGVVSQRRKVKAWNLEPLRTALQKQLLPVVYGDVVFDTDLGGTILSTEDLFVYLAGDLKPDRILLAGLDPGVWVDYPERTSLLTDISPANQSAAVSTIGQSAATDVTGGMAQKVSQMLELIRTNPTLEALIFSGEEAGSIQEALLGDYPGTRIHN
jgi:isopentenyl phosphate kinase